MRVNVFFPCLAGDPDEYTEYNPFNLQAFSRTVSDTEPARGVVNQLIAGPVDSDEAALPLDTAFLDIGMITILHGICRVSLKPGEKFQGFISELSRLCLRDAITRSLLPFDSVDRVVVAVEL